MSGCDEVSLGAEARIASEHGKAGKRQESEADGTSDIFWAVGWRDGPCLDVYKKKSYGDGKRTKRQLKEGGKTKRGLGQ